MKKILIGLLAVLTALSFVTAAGAVNGLYYVSRQGGDLDTASAVTYPSGVTDEMCRSSYWYDKGLPGSDRVMLTKERIAQINQDIIDGSGTQVFDLRAVGRRVYDATALSTSLAGGEIPKRDLYIGGLLIDNDAYFGNLNQAIAGTGFTETQRSGLYCVCVDQTEMRAWPTTDIIGYYADDPDDEMQSAVLQVNEPFIARQKCEVAGNVFYWGYSNNCNGWVSAGDVALCADESQWLSAWQVDVSGTDFIVVTQDKIVMEPSITVPATSEVKLTLGTVLKLVPEQDIPENIGERNGWNNYVIYLPTRDENGNYVKQIGLISQHCSVSVGFLPFTQQNLMDVAFSCLGNRYGWGGMLDSMDCTLYSRAIYRCFGFEIPRNTTWQQKIPGSLLSLAGMTNEEKQKFISTLPSGALLYFYGHCMVYTGTVNGVNYVISNLGKASDSEGELDVKSVYSCTLVPLTVRRANGLTWLENMETVILVTEPIDIGQCQVSWSRVNGLLTARVTYRGMELYEGINYQVTRRNGVITVTGLLNFTGSESVVPTVYQPEEYAAKIGLDACRVTVNKTSALVPAEVSVTYANTALSQNRDFTVSEKNGLVTVTGTGNYCGKVERFIAPMLFDDVRESDYFCASVSWAAGEGITANSGRFVPGEACTRAQFVTFLYRAAGQPAVQGSCGFADVPAGSYYEQAVIWAVQKGIVTGVTASRFAPDAPCTREQAVTCLMRFCGGKANMPEYEFTDVPRGPYYVAGIRWALDNGIAEGVSSTRFGVGDSCTRAQLVTMLYRLIVVNGVNVK